MNISKNLHVSRVALEEAQKSIESKDYDRALEMLTGAYSLVRRLMEHVWTLKRDEVLSASSAGEDGT